MDKCGNEETCAYVGCNRCEARFFRMTVYRGLRYRESCPKCTSRDLRIIKADVTDGFSTVEIKASFGGFQ